MKKIGIYGGTFNPIHNGHLNIAKQMGEMLGLDYILIIPANVAPHKVGIPIIDWHHRYEMCRLACKGNHYFQVCDIELKRKGRSYTIDTLNYISNKYHDSHLYLMMGSDSFFSIIKWVGFEKIIQLVTLCVAPRNANEIPQLLKFEKDLRNKGATTRICDIHLESISSSEIRYKISKGLSVEEMLPIKIIDYIKRNGLYVKNGRVR